MFSTKLSTPSTTQWRTRCRRSARKAEAMRLLNTSSSKVAPINAEMHVVANDETLSGMAAKMMVSVDQQSVTHRRHRFAWNPFIWRPEPRAMVADSLLIRSSHLFEARSGTCVAVVVGRRRRTGCRAFPGVFARRGRLSACFPFRCCSRLFRPGLAAKRQDSGKNFEC